MAKIAYTSFFLVVMLLLSIPSALSAESSAESLDVENLNSISLAPSESDYASETTSFEAEESTDTWFNWIFDFMGGVDSGDEAAGAPAPQPEYAENAVAPALAPASWTLRHLRKRFQSSSKFFGVENGGVFHCEWKWKSCPSLCSNGQDIETFAGRMCHSSNLLLESFSDCAWRNRANAGFCGLLVISESDAAFMKILMKEWKIFDLDGQLQAIYPVVATAFSFSVVDERVRGKRIDSSHWGNLVPPNH
ncbi:hypothetical protein Tsubulata_045967 [Turnera subulata]|uniref:Uncharacterized protein n=1 Tax=Turnera subulata TaxID=218843 RepID=A0A9Q0F2X3_9ROSI|nr:hypothetical protein Tsubulata_045967 [Turnera subulata]